MYFPLLNSESKTSNGSYPKEGVTETDLPSEGSGAPAWTARRSGGCPLPGGVQGQARWGFEQPGLVEGSLLMAEGLEPDGL